MASKPAKHVTSANGSTRTPNQKKHEEPKEGIPFRTTYEFQDVHIEPDFLTTCLPESHSITYKEINFAKTALPEYSGAYAAVLDNVITPSECERLLRLVESSVPESKRGNEGNRFWQPALVNVGGGLEVLESSYRNSDRIIWDQQEIVDRLWQRCLLRPEVRKRFAVVENDKEVLGLSRRSYKQKWEFRRLNNRMRFLKYGPGQFFRAHCDAAYREPGDKVIKTLFTLHLYLNDSKAESSGVAPLIGGSTSFRSVDDSRRLDVECKAGRVLIFQHNRLYHCGDDVVEGIKYTMRTDLLYEMMPKA